MGLFTAGDVDEPVVVVGFWADDLGVEEVDGCSL